jgi:hypothetical protein
MHKLGDKRGDGYIYIGLKKNNNGRAYEMWASPASFFKQFGDDFFERRDARLAKRNARNESKSKWHETHELKGFSRSSS